jgi:integrase
MQERRSEKHLYERRYQIAHLQRIIICAYETGMRAGEIKGLTWDKIDLKTGFVRLAAEDTKTNEKRSIPISPALQEVLEDIRKARREGKVTSIGGTVFTWGGRAMSERWKRAFQTAYRSTKIEGLRFHDIQHTFVTRKVKEGWDYKRIVAITGHKTFATFQQYNNPSEEDVKEVVAASPPVMVQKGSR